MGIQIRDIHTHIHTVCIDAYSCIFYISIYLHIIRCIMCTYFIYIYTIWTTKCVFRSADVSLLDPLLLQLTLLVLLPLLLLQRLLPGLSMDGVKDVCVFIYIQKGTLSGPHVSPFLKMQCFCYILFDHLCSYTCYGITRDPHRLSDFP